MSFEYKERRFEEDIEQYLLTEGGYTSGNLQTYDQSRAIDIPVLIDFIKSTQPKAWQRYETIYKNEVEKKLYKRFNDEVNAHGLLHVLRNGISDRGVKFDVVSFKPETTMNTDHVDRYKKNVLSVTRQFAYSTENQNTLDMVLSLNGIPIVAIELKNQITGQTVENAKNQFMYDRNAKELCFQFNKRFLVYFAVDLYDVAMTTKLNGKNTYFLPFNQGSNGAGNVGGAGNPENPEGYSTSYLWERVLNKDSLLNIIHRFLHLSVGKTKSATNLIFPRYHQLDVVNRIIADVKEKGSGHSYLIQHSAGSGKSNSIAWAAYRLASLHDRFNSNIFTSIIVVTDRKVLDNQLQETISSFDHKFGLVESIDDRKTSQHLKDAINSGKKIIITTLQKFPVIYEEIDDNTDKRFAIIVDEAHSSQTGSSAQKLKTALSNKKDALKEYALIENQDEVQREDFEDKIVKELISHGKHKNLSFFAFTATPKQKTLEMFGELQKDGTFRPFHVYSMRQAIEEGFIHDVLRNYMTYEICYKIAKDTPDNPEFVETEARKAIKRYESFHSYTLQQQTAVMVETYRDNTARKIGGKAKAMVVTSSRLHAVRYYMQFKQYIKTKGYSDLGVLVAFSGTVYDKGEEYTEVGLNHKKSGEKISEKQLPAAFRSDEFNILIVAEKYQTGFDEPLLHTMFVDKPLAGVKAVQTLSRLNRTMKGKNDTFIMDFVNSAESIKYSFIPFYEETILDEEINVNLIYETQTLLRLMNLYNDEDIEKFNKIYYKTGKQSSTDLGKIMSIFKPILTNYDSLNSDSRFQFKKGVRNFVKWYAYIIQITRMFDKGLQKEYNFLKYLSKVLPNEKTEKVNLEDKIKLEYYRIDKTFDGDLFLEPSAEPIILKNPKNVDAGKQKDKNKELLDIIIKQINERFGSIFTEGDRVIVETMLDKVITTDKKMRNKLKRQAKNNNAEIFQDSIFPKIFKDIANECYTEQVEAFSKLFANQEYYNTIMDEMGKVAYRELRNEA